VGGAIGEVDYPSRVVVGEPIVFTGYVGDREGNPVPGERVELWLWDGTVVDETVTDENGFFKLAYTPEKPGRYDFEIWTEQGSRFPARGFATVVVERMPLRLKATIAVAGIAGIIGAVALYKFLKKRR